MVGMNIEKFFQVMEQIHFFFGFPSFPEKLDQAPLGVICQENDLKNP